MRDAHAVRCDWKPEKADYAGSAFCSAVFRSFAQLTALRGQLEAAGWTIQPGSRTRETKHFCPDHKPSPVITEVTSPSKWSIDTTE
jgi:hypothetical protein